MSRPLPDCALCGKSLAYKGRILLRYGCLAGAPEVGWHPVCSKNDPLFRPETVNTSAGNLVRVICERGYSRVISLRRYAEKGGCRRAYGPGIEF
jgi:hypothetical protein